MSSAARPASSAGSLHAARDGAQILGDRSEGIGKQSVVGPLLEPLGLDDPRPAQHLEVMAYERLGDVEFVDEMAHAELLGAQSLDDPPTGWFGKRLEDLDSPVRSHINDHTYVRSLMEAAAVKQTPGEPVHSISVTLDR